MSQHDLTIANQGFPAFRSDLNDALQALGSMQSGTSAPATTFANMLWYDTTNNIVKMRNEDNDAWISLFTLDQSGDLVSAISAATGSFGVLSATGNVTLGDSSSDTATINAKTTFGSEISAPNTFGFKNRIINGAMMIDQRNAGAAKTSLTSQYLVDRWIFAADVGSKFTFQQNYGSVTPPAGFSNYSGFYVASAYTPSGNEISVYQQAVEGFNFADMAWGTASAASITLSFWVRSSLTGTFGGAFRNSATTRSYPFSYTISAANTWEQKTVTIAGDTSGTWVGATNGVGVYLDFDLGSANGSYRGPANAWATTTGNGYIGVTSSVQVVANAGATWYITGVQLEKGSTATSFDYRPYGTEFALCCRYYQIAAFTGIAANTGEMGLGGGFPVYMRATPSMNTQVTSGVDGISLGNTLTKVGTGSVTVGSATTGFASSRGIYNMYCTGLASGGVYVGSTTVSAEL